MTFRITGLSPEPFRHLFGLPDAELAKRRARRVVVEGSGYPERIEMRDAAPGDVLLLVNHEHQPADTPYRASHAVYVREGATGSYAATDEIPEVLRCRLLSLRAFDRADMMIDADVINGTDAQPAIERLFADGRTAYIHAHYAKHGCYAARIDRSPEAA
ncbi:MAG: DUF1203 domain-containing protein [Sphingomonadaceae bacterium]|nr:DUF1203 domain-containing protein [Sphingomonadaceae bacterium]